MKNFLRFSAFFCLLYSQSNPAVAIPCDDSNNTVNYSCDTPYVINSNNQTIAITAGGNIAFDSSPLGNYSDGSGINNTGSNTIININTNSNTDGINITGDNGLAIAVSAGSLSQLNLITGRLSSDNSAGSSFGTVTLNGVLTSSPTINVGQSSGGTATIENTANAGTAINSLNGVPTNLTLNINATGTVRATSHVDSIAIKLRDTQNDSTFTLNNQGTINTSSTQATAILLIGFSANIQNSGTINGDILGANDKEIILTNSGTINGDIDLANVTTSSATITSGTINGNITMNDSAQTVTLSGGAVNGTISGGNLTVSEGSSISSITLSGVTLNNLGTIGSLNVSGSGNSLTLTSENSFGNISNSGDLEISNSSDITYSSAISGSGSITKDGSGILELSGNNTYNGTTLVSDGELKVNGSIASSSTTVASGATISGTGTVGSLTIQSGATLSAGNSPGTLNVNGALNLNAGSISDFEFSSSEIDKIIATGNITIDPAAIANFKLFGPSGYFTVSQDVLETTGGTVSGAFGTVNTEDGFSTSLDYSDNTRVRATVSSTLNTNTLDGVVSAQNSVGRLIAKSLTDQLRNSQYSDDKLTTVWISSGGFNSNMNASTTSAGYSTNGYLTSAGLISNFGDYKFVGGVFNSRANVSRFGFSGKDEMDSNGFALALGRNFENPLGDLYAFTQFGAGFYNFDTQRNVNVNGANQVGKGSGTGNFQYLGIGASQSIKTNSEGEFGIFTSATLQKTQNNGWKEKGLAAGNLNISSSAAQTLNFELGSFYQNYLPKILHLNKGSFYKLELTGYKSELDSTKSATVRESSATYSLTPTYNQKFMLGASAFFSVPLTESSTITARFDRRQNGDFREFIATGGYLYHF